MSSNQPQPWCLMESDPWVFTDLLRKFGVKGAQMVEVCSLEDIDEFKSVYGLLFLFKCKKTSDPSFANNGSFVEDSSICDIYFAKQMIVNACATQALINMLLNIKDIPSLELGETLSNFREFSSSMDAEDKGLALDYCDPIRSAHNSFARPNMFALEEDNKKDEDSFHYVGFVPICGRLIELDGLKKYPIDHGNVAKNWVETASDVLKARMPESATGDFNLLAMTFDRKEAYTRELEALRKHVSQSVAETTELQRIGELEQLLAEEEKQQLRYEIDSIRHAHNWAPFIMETMKLLAKYGQLTKVMEDKVLVHAAVHQSYDPKHAAVLEDYLRIQAEKGFYNREANCALLSIYRYWPETFNEQCVCLILLKAIMELPHSDFTLSKIMLTRFDTDAVNRIIELGTLLESCRFIKFWEAYQGMIDDDLAIQPDKVLGFEKAVQRCKNPLLLVLHHPFGLLDICYAIELSFESVEVIMLKQMLNHPSDDMLDDLIDANNWRFIPANRQLEQPASVYTFDHTNVIKGAKVFTGPKLQDVLKSLH